MRDHRSAGRALGTHDVAAFLKVASGHPGYPPRPRAPRDHEVIATGGTAQTARRRHDTSVLEHPHDCMIPGRTPTAGKGTRKARCGVPPYAPSLRSESK